MVNAFRIRFEITLSSRLIHFFIHHVPIYTIKDKKTAVLWLYKQLSMSPLPLFAYRRQLRRR